MTPAPFDTVAAEYDAAFTDHVLGRWLRGAVWKHLDAAFQPGDRVLELGCGTGEDALHLAQRGVHVHATDAAETMVHLADQKALLHGVAQHVTTQQLDLNTLTARTPILAHDHATTVLSHARAGDSPSAPHNTPRPFGAPLSRGDLSAFSTYPDLKSSADDLKSPLERGAERSEAGCVRPPTEQALGQGRDTPALYDGAFSNFGALNGVADVDTVAHALSRWVRPGGRLVLVVMGPWCPWEWGWYLARGQVRTAFRRFRRGGQAHVGDGATMRVWYPSPRRLRTAFAPYFMHRQTVGVGVLLPPTFARSLVDRWPSLFAKLARLDARAGRVFPGTRLNDHYLTVFERLDQDAPHA